MTFLTPYLVVQESKFFGLPLGIKRYLESVAVYVSCSPELRSSTTNTAAFQDDVATNAMRHICGPGNGSSCKWDLSSMSWATAADFDANISRLLSKYLRKIFTDPPAS